MKKFLSVILPVLAGIIAIWILLKIEAFFHKEEYDGLITHDLIVLIPLMFVLTFVQVIFVLPIWKNFLKKGESFTQFANKFTLAFSTISGFCVGLIFWSKQLGVNDLFISVIMGMLLSGLFIFVNLLVLRKIDKS